MSIKSTALCSASRWGSLMADSKKVVEALRRQVDAQERNEEMHEQQLAEFYASNPGAKRLKEKETPAQRALIDKFAKELSESWEPYDLTHQMEGFVAGWLVASGHFDQYREILQIWLDTPKQIGEPDPLDVAGLLARVSDSPRAQHG